jgi:myo-inositol catabolism protein IolC
MTVGYSSPLYTLSCDQRAPLVSGLFGWHEPLDAGARAQVAAVKSALYAGFRRAAAANQAHHAALIAVDPDWGVDIFRHAASHGFLTAVTLDPPDGDAADLELTDALAALDEMPAPFAKVRVVADGNAARHAGAMARLGRLMAPLRARHRRLILELHALDSLLALRTMQRLQSEGIDPDVWILDPLDAELARLASEIARRGGRDDVSCVVQLGGDDVRAHRDVVTAACVDGFVGFGVAPALLRADVAGWLAGALSWDELVAFIAARYGAFIDAFEPLAQKTHAAAQHSH